MTIAQDIRLAYESRDREGLERLLARVEVLRVQRDAFEAHVQALMTQAAERKAHDDECASYHGYRPVRDSCTCQRGPNWTILIGAIGEPAKCAFCNKTITLVA